MQDEINVKPNKSYENLKKISVVLNAIAYIIVTPVLFALQYSILMISTNGARSLSTSGSVEGVFISIAMISVMLFPLGLAAKVSAHLIKIYLLDKKLLKAIKADKLLMSIYISIFCIVYYSFYVQYVFSSYRGI